MRTFLLLALVGCQVDNEITKGPESPAFDTGGDTEPPVADPEIAADPAFISEIGVCGSVSRTITLSNSGATDLTLSSLSLDGDGWTMEPPATPLTLGPGDTVDVPVTGGAGSAVLTVVSDAVNDSRLEIPLDAVADAPPTVSILTPSAAEVLDVGTQIVAGTVSDDVDAPESLAIEWGTYTEGVIGTDPANPDGSVLYTWDSSAHTSGSQVITLQATDSCGNVSITHVGVCQQAGYLEDNIDLASWHFEGGANWDSSNNWLELTKPIEGQLASAFNTGDLVSGDNVQIEFLFYVSGGSGADGISLTALDVDRMTTYLGASGGSIGYGAAGSTPGLPGWSIEVDTYDNGRTQDPTDADHLMFTFDGDPAGGSAWAALPDMEDGAWHTMTVDVSDPHVTVAIDGVTYLDQDISGYFGFPAYVGFTAATGALTNYHLIDALEVTQYVCEE